MKTETLPAGTITIKVEEKLIQLNEKKVNLNLKNNELSLGDAAFTGYILGESKIAILQNFNYETETDGQQLITQACMIAWELGYELLISAKSSEILSNCGFQSFKHFPDEIYCAELTWNAYAKIDTASITTLAQLLN